MDLKNYFCPVCGNDFNEDDDVVFCPECGTPHHRSCWMENGKCINENLHGTEEGIEVTYTKASSEKVKAPKVEKEPVQVENQDEPAEVIHRNIEINANTSINGKPTYLYEIALKKNQQYYIPRFAVEDQGIKAPSWNFVGFLVPLAWTLYRKMYKLSAIILAIYLAIVSVSAYFILSDEQLMDVTVACAQEDPQFASKVLMYEAGEDVILTPLQQEYMKELDSVIVPGYVTNISTILLYGIRFFMGLCGNKMYFKKLSRSIEKGIGKGLSGDSLKMFVYKKNGVLPIAIAVLVGIAEWFMI